MIPGQRTPTNNYQRNEVASSYNGNKLLKQAGVRHEYSEEEKKELLRCSEDCGYFINKYVKIVTIDKGLVPFDTWSSQDKIINTCQQDQFVLIKMGRQSGKTSTISAILLWHVLFNDYYLIVICANKAKGAASVLARVKLAYVYLPKWMQQGIVSWNKGDIELENGSRILTFGTSADAGRGETANLLYLDEFCHVPRNIQTEFFTSVYPTITSGESSKCIITSTPKGLDYFYKLWMEAKQGKNSYIPIEVKWDDHPKRDEAWKEKTIGDIGQKAFDEEYNCDFLGSSNTLISSSVLKRIPTIEPIKIVGDLKIYKKPIAGHNYVITVDTARGGGGDYSAFVVIDISSENNFEIVATYKNNEIQAVIYPIHIVSAATSYNEADVLVETNDLGEQVTSILYDDLEYENLLKTKQAGPKGIILTGGATGGNVHRGIKTTKSTKAKGCSNLKALIEFDRFIINDFDVLSELSNFISNRNSYSAASGEHDDLVMCLVLFAWMIDQRYFKDLTDIDMRKIIHQKNQEEKDASESVIEFMSSGFSDEEDETLFIGNSKASPVVVEENGVSRGIDHWFSDNNNYE